MKNVLSRNKFRIITSAAAFAVSLTVKMLIDHGYEKSTGDDPPKNPDDVNYHIGEVLLYASATALAGAATKVLIRHFMTQKWIKEGGKVPKNLA